jgi:hypothetical protein
MMRVLRTDGDCACLALPLVLLVLLRSKQAVVTRGT